MRVLIVDGYNAVHAWPSLLAALRRHTLEEARRRLVEQLGEYAARREVEVIVVFDSQRPPPAERSQQVDGVTVQFGHRHTSADHLIERMASQAARAGRAEEVVVATSDRLQRDLVHGMGVATMATLTLEAEVARAHAEVREQAQRMTEAAHSAHRVEHRIPVATRRLLEAMRRGLPPPVQ